MCVCVCARARACVYVSVCAFVCACMCITEGEQGTWVSMQLAGPTQGLVDMVMVDINGSR